MELFVFGVLALVFVASPVVLLVLYVITRDRVNKLGRSVDALRDTFEARVDELEARLSALGDGVEPAEAIQPAAAAGAEHGLQPADESELVAQSRMVAEPGPEAEPPAPAETLDERPGKEASPLAWRETAAGEAVAERATKVPSLAGARTSAEWEELIGGSWLNKIGAVVTVIGMALALGYSMRYLGPAGRIALALAISGTMLGMGGFMESRERYRIFARGLIGGGWAGLYFTTFAMHGLEEARIIENPVIGTVLLVAVAVGMVLHSLAYRSETVTGLAYFVTFATLAIVPMSRFALFASVPAAASLLYIGRRFRWAQMMVAGVVFTYGVYLVRGGSPDVGPEDWAFGQTLLFVYWILFEAFDLLSLRGREPGSLGETLFPLNAAGFIGASLLGWSTARVDSLWVFFALAAAAFVASAALRARLVPPPKDDDAVDLMSLLRGGGYQASLLVAAILLVFSIGRGFDGWQQNVAWLLEAQLFVLSGVVLRNRFVRHLGSAVLAVPVLAVIIDDLPSSTTFVALSHTWWRSTPLALLTALVLYVDRALTRGVRGVRVAGLEHLYNWVGTFLVAAVLANELPDVWIAPAWFALGLGLVALSLARGAGELFVQGYVAVAASWVVMLLGNVPMHDLVWGWEARWVTALPMVAVLYGLAYVRRAADGTGRGDPGGAEADRTGREDTDGAQADPAESPTAGGLADTAAPGRLDDIAAWLDRGAAATMFAAATLLMSWFLLFEVSGHWLTVAWGLQGVALLVTGFVFRVRQVRLTGLALLGVCIAKLALYDVSELEMIFRIFSFLILGVLMLLVSFAYSRYREEIRRLL